MSPRLARVLKISLLRNKRFRCLGACNHVKARRAGFTEDRLCACHFFRRTVRHHQKPVSFYGGLVLDYAVLRHADAIEGRAKCAQPADNDRVLDAGDRNGGEISKHDDMPDEGNGHEQAAKEQSPKTAPERTARAPKLDPVASIVKADDLFVGMVTLADNAEVLHLEAGRGQFFDGCFRCGMVGKDGNN